MRSGWQRWRDWRNARHAAAALDRRRACSEALVRAVVERQPPAVVQGLLDQGADPNARFDARPLVLVTLDTFQAPVDWDEKAAGRGLQVLDALLNAGAEPNAKPVIPSLVQLADTSDPMVRSGLFVYDHPLHQAVSDGFAGAVRRLLRQGASLTAQARIQGDLCWGPVLHQARDATMATVLIDGGADVHAVDSHGATALDRAQRARPLATDLVVVLERAVLGTDAGVLGGPRAMDDTLTLTRRRL